MATIINKPKIRLLGVTGFLVTVLLYQHQTPGFTHQLVIPLLAAICAWMACQNLSAVAFGTGFLAILATDTASPDGFIQMVYPIIGVICGGYLAYTWLQVFRQKMADTQEARWQNRRSISENPAQAANTGEDGPRSVNLPPLKISEDTKGNDEF